MKRVLVTGGAGVIGSTLVRRLHTAGHAVVNLDLRTYAACPATLSDLRAQAPHEFVQGDVCDGALVDRTLREHGIDTVVHLAAETHVDRSIVGPAPFVRTSVLGTFTLLEAVRRVWLDARVADPARVRFHHVSTDEVYGALAPDDPPWNEASPYDPRSPYAASKAAADHLVRAYAHTYGLPATISTACNNYGPYQFPEKLVPLAILHAIEGRTIPVYGDGLQVRDWIHVDDHAAALCAILERGVPGRTYAVSGGVQSTNLDLLRRICGIVDAHAPRDRPAESLVRHVADRAGHDRRYAQDGAAARALGWAPVETLDTGLPKTVAWYLDRTDWIAAARAAPEYDAWMKRNYDAR